ncbi:MAG: molybdenum cofactor biosynthesis protein MoaE [Bacteroidota bacterium]|jgi:molybdopterin synthase catalytic subunit|nr:molybdenum cofactor biosynthesis protein MoaE [Bacteroidota bacterium]
MVRISEEPIDVNEVIDNVRSAAAGAIDVFIGTVRNKTSQKSVSRLDFEAYDAMAVKEIKKIIEKARDRWPVLKMSIYHRKGILSIGEIAVVIAVSTPHRKESFEACQFAIDTLKETVPIWKKEVFEDGEVWVSAHP